ETLDSSLGHRHFLFAFRSHRLVVLLAGQRFRPRFRISCCFLAGHRLPVEGRHYLPALDCLDEPRFRRAALHLLSAAFLDSWRCSQPGSSRDVDPSCIHRSGPDLCGPLGVLSTPPARQRTCGHPRRRLLRHKSLCTFADLHSQRLRRAARLRHLSPLASGRTPPRKSPRSTFTQIRPDCLLRDSVCGCLAHQRPRWCHRQLFPSSCICLGGDHPALVEDRSSHCLRAPAGFWPDLLLSDSCSLRTTLGQHRPSPGQRPFALPEFPLHLHRRRRTFLVQLDRFLLCNPSLSALRCCGPCLPPLRFLRLSWRPSAKSLARASGACCGGHPTHAPIHYSALEPLASTSLRSVSLALDVHSRARRRVF